MILHCKLHCPTTKFTMIYTVCFLYLSVWIPLPTFSSMPPDITCETRYSGSATPSGVYYLVANGLTFQAFCLYNDDSTGYFFPATDALDTMSQSMLDKQYSRSDEILFRTFSESAGTQADVVIYPLSSDSLFTALLNDCAGSCPKTNGPFLNINFVNKSALEAGATNGWRDSVTEYLVPDCENGSLSDLKLINAVIEESWNNSDLVTISLMNHSVMANNGSVLQENSIKDFSFVTEFHFGNSSGCGVWEITTDWSEATNGSRNISGTAIGFKFDIYDSCADANACRGHGFCTDLINGYLCDCYAGYTGDTCQYENVQMGCSLEIDILQSTDHFSAMSMPLNKCQSNCKIKQFLQECTCWVETGTTKCSTACITLDGASCGSMMNNAYSEPITSCNKNHCEYCGSVGVCLKCQNGFYLIGETCVDLAYRGCFKDNSTAPAMQGFALNMTSIAQAKPTLCFDFCREIGFDYAGLEDKMLCFCGNSYAMYGRTNETECSSKLNVRRGRYNKVVRNSVWIYPANTLLKSTESTIGVIDCVRELFQTEGVTTFRHDASNNQCLFYKYGHSAYVYDGQMGYF